MSIESVYRMTRFLESVKYYNIVYVWEDINLKVLQVCKQAHRFPAIASDIPGVCCNDCHHRPVNCALVYMAHFTCYTQYVQCMR